MKCEMLDFDDIVVGSSPLMLMQAMRLALDGQKVLVIDRNPRIGGSWAVAEIEPESAQLPLLANSNTFVEIACHLIEVFPGVYERLERLCGVPFVPLDPQPIRVLPCGLTLQYFSRFAMLASFVRLLFGCAQSRLWLVQGRKEALESRINFDRKLAGYLRYQLPVFFGDTTIYGPRDGYVDFIKRIEQRCQEAGVTFAVGEVTEMTLKSLGWHLSLEGERSGVAARHVHLSTSTNLRPKGPNQFIGKPLRFASRSAWVVEIPEAHIKTPHTYVSFWHGSEIARISKIDTNDYCTIGTHGHIQFLVEIRPFLNKKSCRSPSVNFLRKYIEQAGIISPGGSLNIFGRVICKHVRNTDQISAGKIANGVWGYTSNGNLAAGVAAWMNQNTISDQGNCVSK
jgi:hypothetical protein